MFGKIIGHFSSSVDRGKIQITTLSEKQNSVSFYKDYNLTHSLVLFGHILQSVI